MINQRDTLSLYDFTKTCHSRMYLYHQLKFIKIQPGVLCINMDFFFISSLLCMWYFSFTVAVRTAPQLPPLYLTTVSRQLLVERTIGIYYLYV